MDGDCLFVLMLSSSSLAQRSTLSSVYIQRLLCPLLWTMELKTNDINVVSASSCLTMASPMLYLDSSLAAKSSCDELVCC